MGLFSARPHVAANRIQLPIRLHSQAGIAAVAARFARQATRVGLRASRDARVIAALLLGALGVLVLLAASLRVS